MIAVIYKDLLWMISLSVICSSLFSESLYLMYRFPQLFLGKMSGLYHESKQ